MSKGARPPSGEADEPGEGLITGGQPELPNAREELGRGSENGRVSETEPGSHDRVIFERREATRAADLLRGLQHRRKGLAGARCAVHNTRTGYAGYFGIAMNGVVVEVVRDPDVVSYNHRIRERLAA